MAHNHPDFDIVAINDLGEVANLAYLLKYDTAYGQSQFSVEAKDDQLVIDGALIEVTHVRNPEELPWGEKGIDIVIEATGVFASYEESKAHLTAGAKRVVISGPVKDDPAAVGINGATVLMGVNDTQLASCDIFSNASCTTNATSPLIAILKEAIGIEKAILNTVHAYTSTQSIVDGLSKIFVRVGSAKHILTSTGAASTTKAHTDLTDKFDGISMRVPVPVGSIVDVTFVASQDTTEAVNEALR